MMPIMSAGFEHLDIVKVVSQPPASKKPVAGLEGIIVGQSDPYPDGHRDYGVHFNDLGEVCSVPEQFLTPVGRKANRSEIVTRSRLHQARRHLHVRAFFMRDVELSVSGMDQNSVRWIGPVESVALAQRSAPEEFSRIPSSVETQRMPEQQPA